MPLIPGYVEFDSQFGGGLVGNPNNKGMIDRLPTKLVNGSITVSIIAKPERASPLRLPVLFRTGAAAQQGKVSFLDMPYNFTTVGGTSVTKLNLVG